MTFTHVFALSVDWGEYAPDLLDAIVRTLEFTVLGFAGAVACGLVVAVARMSPLRPLRLLARGYLELFRNLPLISELFIIYFGLTSAGIRLSPLAAGCLALALFYGAYLSEIFRGGLEGVPKGQLEASQAVGLTASQAFAHVTLPLAVRLALPGASTMLVDLLKGTSLMVTIGGAELMTQGQIMVSDTFQPLEVYAGIGLIYVALAFPLSQFSVSLERQLRAGAPLTPRRRRLHAVARGLTPPEISAAVEPEPSSPVAPEGPVIVIEGLVKRFGQRTAVDGVDIDVAAGEVLSIVGKSGSGKSTLLRCLNLLERPDAGAIHLQGDGVFGADGGLHGRDLVVLRRRLGMVFQSLHLFPHLTAIENVALPLVRGAGLEERAALRRAAWFLGRVGLGDRALDRPEQLSGGQQQRVAIARALALRPVALLFDEPTSALDPESTGEVLAVMRELRDEGMTMIIVTHELAFAREASDRVALMHDGRFTDVGPAARVLAIAAG